MARTVSLHNLDELAKAEVKNEILLDVNFNTELHIIKQSDRTIINFPFGNKFDIVDGCIIIHPKP